MRLFDGEGRRGHLSREQEAELSVPICAWDGANNSYLATAGLDNTAVTANTEDPPDVLFSVQATVLPLTIWSGNQGLRLKLDLWTRKVTATRPTTGETLADRPEALPDRLTTSPAAPKTDRIRRNTHLQAK